MVVLGQASPERVEELALLASLGNEYDAKTADYVANTPPMATSTRTRKAAAKQKNGGTARART